MSRGGVCISCKLKQIASHRTARDKVVVLKLGYASESPAKTQDSGAAYKLSDGALAWHSRLLGSSPAQGWKWRISRASLQRF